MITDFSQISEVVATRMKTWPLRDSEDRIRVCAINDLAVFVGFDSQFIGSCRWDANIFGSTFYLLNIEIKIRDRLIGHGDSLYRIIEQIAADLGCSQIRQTPSGWTPRGETRESYLVRRGWIVDGREVFKKLNGAAT